VPTPTPASLISSRNPLSCARFFRSHLFFPPLFLSFPLSSGIVALSGAHTLGRCHTDRSGFDGPWTNAPTTFSNLYFTELTDNKWRKRDWSGPMQYEDPTKTLMMLPTDMALVSDRKFRKVVTEFAKDEDAFRAAFADSFGRLLDLGVPRA